MSYNNKKLIHLKFPAPRKLGTGRDIEAWKESKRKGKVPAEKMPDSFMGVKAEMVDYTIPNLETRKKVRSDFAAIRKEFLIYVATNKREELLKEGFTKKQITTMKKGTCPKAYNVHHILPIHGGGDNGYDNLCIIRAKPVHEKLHNEYINPQIREMKDGDSRQIKLPSPKGAIFYTPENLKTNANKKIVQAIVSNLKNR